ncbi:MAG: chorismate-binding protein, partial [Alphaproteobacteria bacterium]|nr:chorismate-binding protein [Alphaproteobacteria bacterium]
MKQTETFALFDDATWPDRPAVFLSAPQALIEARSAAEVPAALAAIEDGVARGLSAAGYFAYELGYALEPRLLPLMPPNAGPLLRFHLFSQQRRMSARERTRWLMEQGSGSAAVGAITHSIDEAAYRAKLARVRQLIGEGDVYQVNLTFKLKTTVGDPFATYARLRERARAGACAFLRFADEDVLSFSPELFFEVREGHITARPMKGTTPRAGDGPGDDKQRAALSGDEKQRAENLMIVDLLRNDLSRVTEPGSVEVTDLFTVETYPRFHTLTSGIRGRLAADASLSSIVRALFPCG